MKIKDKCLICGRKMRDPFEAKRYRDGCCPFCFTFEVQSKYSDKLKLGGLNDGID